jgi:hypothetical protein
MPKQKIVPKKKPLPKKKVAVSKQLREKIPAAHIQCDSINDLTEKIVQAVDIEEKVRWSWGLMSECRVLESSSATNKHMAKCKSCRDFLNARKSLAELIIKAGRI